MNTIAVACIGAGHWGKNLVRNFHELGSLAVICDADAARREAMAREYPRVRVVADAEAVFLDEEVKAVALATPAETHGHLVRMALAAGKDVLVEKPLCLDPEQGRVLVDYARANGRILMVGHLLCEVVPLRWTVRGRS